MKLLGLAILTSVMLVLAQAPFGWWPLAWCGLVPLTLLWHPGEKFLGRLVPAYLGGAALFLLGCYWLAESSPVNLILMTVAEALSFPFYLLLVRSFRRRAVPFALVVPVAWVAVEFIRSHGPFNGFPWLLLGYSLHRPIVLAQAADLAGVFGLSALLACCNGLLLDAWFMRARRAVAASLLGAAVAIPLLLLLYGQARMASVLQRESAGPVLAIAQAGVPQGLKRQRESALEIFDHQMRTTTALMQEGRPFDLLCWAETMFPFPLLHGDDEASFARDREFVADPLVRPLLRDRGASFLFGSLTLGAVRDADTDVYNSALLFDPEGRRVGRYSKTVLVPGGEFLPLRDQLPDSLGKALDDLVKSITGGFLPRLAAGDGPIVHFLRCGDGRSFRFSTTICYENCYPGYGARAAREQVDFVVNLSNEAWFKESVEFDQMDTATRFRAIEARRSVVRVTNSGISAVYDAVGRRRATLVSQDGRDRAVAGHLVAPVPIFDSASLFVRTGNLLALILTSCAALWYLVGAWSAVRRYRSCRPT